MSKNKRLKLMTLEQFDEVRKRDWTPVELVDAAVPLWMKNIPSHTLMASGTYSPVESQHIVLRVPGGKLVGGIDVYREAPDDPVELNKDWYAVITDPSNADMLLVDGPIRDDEHWIDEIPERLKGAEILAVPKNTSNFK